MDEKVVKILKLLLCVIFMLMSIYLIYYHYTYKVVESNTNINPKGIIKEDLNRKLISDFRNTYNNNEIVMMVKINGLFKIPIVQTDDNTYYLSHDLYKDSKDGGTVFLDYRNKSVNDKKIILYGYSNISENISFDKLLNYQDENFYLNHKDIKIYTEEGEKTYRIFSCFNETESFDYANLNSYNGLTYYEHINQLKDKSLYDTGVELEENSKILVLDAKKYNSTSDLNSFLVIGVEVPKDDLFGN